MGDGTWQYCPHTVNQHSLTSAMDTLADDAAEQLLLRMASQVKLKDFATAIYLPILSARSELVNALSDAMLEAPEEATKLKADIRQVKSTIADLYIERFGDALLQPAAFTTRLWQRQSLLETTPEQRIDAYAKYLTPGDALNLDYYQERHHMPELGVMISHYFPLLVWVHHEQSGVPVLREIGRAHV